MTPEQERAEFEAWYATQTALGHDWWGWDEERDQYGMYLSRRSWAAWQAGRAALQSQDREDASCTWHNDPETDNSWSTGCHQLFEIYDGTPTENGMGFCCYCGKPIRESIDHARRVEEKK